MMDRRLFKEMKSQPNAMKSMIFGGLASAIWSITFALCVAIIVNKLFMLHEPISSTYPAFGIAIAILILRGISHGWFEYRHRLIALRIKKRLRLSMLESTFDAGKLHNRESTGSSAAIFCESADSIEPYFYDFMPQLFAVSITVPLILIVAFCIDPVSALIMLFTAPLLPLFLALIGMATGQTNRKRLSALKRLGSTFLEALNGMKTLKLFGKSGSHGKTIYESSESFRKTTMEVLRVAFLSAFVLELTATISIAMIAVSLGLRLIYGKMEFFDAFFILLLAPEFYQPIRMLGAKFHTAIAGKEAADKLYKPEPTVDSSEPESIGTSAVPQPISEINLKNLTVQYEGSDSLALDNFSISIPANKTVAIVGKSGAGKSTLAKVLLGLIKPTSGTVAINDISYDTLSPESLRNSIGFVAQNPFLFADSIAENIAFGNCAIDSPRIIEAISKTGLSDLICSLPDGIETKISEDGISVSRGESQRISIARTLVKDSPVIILDEPTSALDNHNQKLIDSTLENLRGTKTILVIAHRLETVRHADLILVMDRGVLAESGTHDQLILKNGTYAELLSAWERGLDE